MTGINVTEVGCFVPAHGHLHATHIYMLNVRRSILRDEQVMINNLMAISQQRMTAATSKVAVYVTSVCRVGICKVFGHRQHARDAHGHITRLILEKRRNRYLMATPSSLPRKITSLLTSTL